MRPERLKILGKPFKVLWLTDELDSSLNGECDSDGQEIKVRDGLPVEQLQDTLLHEVIHAIDEAMDARMSESQVKKLATGLLAVLKDNPRFGSFLKKKNAPAQRREQPGKPGDN